MSETEPLPPYEAMDAKDKQSRRGIVVQLASGETLHLKYPDIHLKRVSGDETVMAVFCYSLNIVLWGRSLRHIARAMDGEYVAWLQEFDPERWSRPADPQAPFIERIVAYAKKDEDGPQPDTAQGQPEGRVRH